MTAIDDAYQRIGDLIARYDWGRDKLLAHRVQLGHSLSQRECRDLARRVREQGGPSVPWTRDELWRRQQEGREVLARLRRGEVTVEELIASVRGGVTAPDTVKAEDTPDDTEWSPPSISTAKEGRYVYDADAETYTTLVDTGTVKTTAEQHRRILEAYSRHGEDRSRIELCRLLGWGWSDVVSYLKAHRAYKNSIPISPEALAAAETDEDIRDLTRSAVAAKYRKAGVLLLQEQLRAAERDADKWRRWEREARSMLAELLPLEPVADLPPIEPVEAPTPYELIVGVSDPHWGMRSWVHETGYHYDRAEARRRIDSGVAQILAWCARHGSPERIVYPFGSDRLHVDVGSQTAAQTTRGTPQHVDGTPLEILRTGLEHDRQVVARLAQVAPVLLVPCRGNHDSTAGLIALEIWRERCKQLGRVELLDTYRQRVALEVAGAWVGITHGHVGQGGPTSPKRRQTDAAWLHQEARRAGWTGRHLMLLKGHVHHRRVVEDGAVIHVTMASLAPPDAWHAASGYTGTAPGVDALVMERGRGMTHRLFFGVEESDGL